ncbi:glycine--tRNA ligase beta subunit [Chitiniphilus shinanonensis]|uniref:Glycine--tRNA ligase beta subunit n=1 Tax=Chitiniphilus shinanonensis TaxID=553088 RepID=A0ABQ6BQR0_9NEIS|nr:glycine--tRNA ligase subunit beta [Chitiniphilus shinanonensis]GLS04161.1 glycine--tRNA ligase beta subunit [Chitiniphilus shinanonensis]
MSQTLLIELLTEELPPKALPKLGAVFAQSIFDELARLGFAPKDAQYHAFASPRRLAVTIPGVLAVQPDQRVERRGPAVSAGFKDGAPTPALAGFARSCGVEVAALEQGSDGKQDVFVFRSVKPGEALSAVLSGVVDAALRKLPAPKMMRWGDRDGQFIRPVHGLVLLHGADVVPGGVLHLQSGRVTRGHRFLSQGEITLPDADSYARTLFEAGKVVASFDARRALIGQKLKDEAARLGATIAADDALFDEVTALVEWPVVLVGEFEADFLKVPQECLILTMQQNQKYFPLLDAAGKLTNRFLLVSNLETADPVHIVEGNARVLRARLSDAKFFYEQDQKRRLEARVPGLYNVVYHNKIGSQLERVERLVKIAGEIGPALGASRAHAERAAYLAKADLLSDMVGEFPELQGVMGTYYARLDGEPAEVADAIEGHYHPRFAGDSLPQTPVATAVALADKLEAIVGIWGIGMIPTGDKDPFGLRRAALGVLRMLLNRPLDLRALLTAAVAPFPSGVIADGTVDGVYGFMLERLKNYLAADYPGADIDAVLALHPTRLDDVERRLVAVAEFKALPEAAALAAANKRIRNILKKVEGGLPALNPALFAEPAEKSLHDALQAVTGPVADALAAHDYTRALKTLAALKAPVDAFFDGVMVMADDAAVRGNRLALLNALAGAMNRVAELSLLAE